MCVPQDVQVEVNDGTMTVMFKDNCTQMKSGYNIYISRTPLVKQYPGTELPATIKPFNHPVFPGDTDPTDGIEHYNAEGLENGVVYYVSVRTVFSDRTLSKPSTEVTAVCGPRGEIELSMRYTSETDGFSFAENKFVRADNVKNDVYFFSKNGKNFLVSPDKLDGFLRKSKLHVLPYKGSFREVAAKINSSGISATEQQVTITPGTWVLLVTEEQYPALLKILEISGTAKKRQVKFFYAFSPRKNAPFF